MRLMQAESGSRRRCMKILQRSKQFVRFWPPGSSANWTAHKSEEMTRALEALKVNLDAMGVKQDARHIVRIRPTEVAAQDQ